jgi:hypothetical protein
MLHSVAMLRLTRQEQKVLALILLLLLVGWATKAYRTAHPPVAPAAPADAKSNAHGQF